MNLIQAVQSGRPFRREGEKDYWDHEAPGFFVAMESILATDWELKPEPREGVLCNQCFEPPQLDDSRYMQTCKDVGHTPFKWRELMEGE